MVRFLRLHGVRAVFRAGVLSEQRSGRAAAQRRGAVRRDLPDAAARRLAVRLHRRPLRPAAVADAVGGLHVLRLADHRGDADLCLDRRRRAGDSGAGARHRGIEPGRRIRRQRHLSQRGRRRQAPRLLFELPIRHADRRPAHRDHRAAAAAEGVPDAGGTEAMGLADPVRDRRGAGDLRRGDAAQPARDRGVRRSGKKRASRAARSAVC